MILADKIINLRKKAGMSQEELADRMNVSRQAVSKWEGAQSVPDLTRILKLSEIFGVSTDYLLKDELEEEEYVNGADALREEDTGLFLHRVSMEEADRFLEINGRSAERIALGTIMCILSPLVLLILIGLTEFGTLALSQEAAVGLGIIVMLLIVAGAVILFVLSGQRLSPFDYLEKEPIETEYGVEGMVKERQSRYEPTHTRELIMGIVICILAAIPIFATQLWMGRGEDISGMIGICSTIALCAVGVYFIVRTCCIWGGFQKLLQEGDYSVKNKEANPVIGIYWMIVTAAFLAYSFITNDWARSWIIWPVAGVVCGILYEIMRIRKK